MGLKTAREMKTDDVGILKILTIAGGGERGLFSRGDRSDVEEGDCSRGAFGLRGEEISLGERWLGDVRRGEKNFAV